MTIFADLQPFVQGDDLEFNLRIKDEYGDPVDVTGDTVYLTLKTDVDGDDGTAVMQIVHVVPASEESTYGIVNVDVTNAESKIAAGTYNYDYQWVTAAGKVTTVALGKVKVYQEVTQT